jgi:hypothetical protein
MKEEFGELLYHLKDVNRSSFKQVILQYADDTSFTLNGKEGSVRRLIQILDILCLGSSLELNWLKSSAFWKGARRSPRPAWTDQLRVSWAGNDELGKLLGAVFDLELSTADVDEFLETKIVKKLNYWCSTKMHVTGRGIIVNGVLLSTTYFFLAI